MQIYSYVKPFALSTEAVEPVRRDVAISELMELPDANARRQRLLDAVLAGAAHPVRSAQRTDVSGCETADAMGSKKAIILY
jgi:hypothetical protein